MDDIKHEALAASRWNALQSIWHKRMGHPHSKILHFMHNKNLISVSSWEQEKGICVSCQMGKSCEIPFYHSNKISKFPLDKIHCDL